MTTTVATATISAEFGAVDKLLAEVQTADEADYLAIAQSVAEGGIWPGPLAVQMNHDRPAGAWFSGGKDITLMALILEDEHSHIEWTGARHGIALDRPTASEVTQAVAEYLLSDAATAGRTR